MSSSKKGWTEQDVPSQEGKVFLVTGANSGLGLETVRVLASRGAQVVLACRDASKGEQAAEKVRAAVPGAKVEVEALDLASLESVRALATKLQGRLEKLDGLCNNAGVMAPPKQQTKEGFELQFGTNHLGHFVLTLALWPLLARTKGSRVVNVSSLYARSGKMDLEDPNWERRRYDEWSAYAQSKLANLLFSLELTRRAQERGEGVLVLSAHPGYSNTNLQNAAATSNPGFISKLFAGVGNRYFAQPAAMGALPQLRALTDPEARAGDYYGPATMLEMGGPAGVVKVHSAGRDAHKALGLWSLSEKLTGASLPPVA